MSNFRSALLTAARAGIAFALCAGPANAHADSCAAAFYEALAAGQIDSVSGHSGTLVFSRYDPDTDDIDLFVSFLASDGWSPAMRLSSLATPEWDMSPAFTPDGEYLLYKSGNGPFRRVPTAELLMSLPGPVINQE